MPVPAGGPAGLDLHLDIDPLDRTRPLRAQLETALREAVRTGRLRPGARLPPSRVLADQLGCSRWVVVETYEQLTAEGYLTSRAGSGTRVAAVRTGTAPGPAARPAAPAARIRIDFSPAAADLTAFPRRDWLRATAAVMATATPADLYYADPAGTPQLRTVLAEHLARVRAVAIGPDRIVVCAGTVAAIGLLARALAAAGHTTLGVEDPGWTRLRPPVAAAGLRVVPVPVDADGLDVAALSAHPQVRAVLVSPAHQFPTGAVLSPDRRAALLHWARQRDGLIIEDDYDAEYRYDRRPVGSLQALDPDRVAYTGSTSKILSPALRIGWLALPPTWHTAVTTLRPGLDLGTSVPDQLSLAHLISTGALEQHLRRTRARYRHRRAATVNALAHHLPEARVQGVAAGLHLIARLPADANERDITAQAGRRGIRVYGLADYQLRQPPPHAGLVLGYAGLNERALDAGIGELAHIIKHP